MSTISTWNPYNQFVQNLDDTVYMSGENTYLAAGPPRLANIGGTVTAAAALSAGTKAADFAMPIGIVQSFSWGQNMNLMRFFEIGSMRSYFVPGKVVGQLSLSRVMYHGASLLRILYAYYQDLVPPTIVPAVFPNTAKLVNPHNTIIPPGYENIFLNLASDLFRQPIGILMYMRDSNDNTMGAVYFEQCFIPSHSMGFDAQGIVIQEQASIQYERPIPVAVSALSLITETTNPQLSVQ
jgi:hypothetical protein